MPRRPKTRNDPADRNSRCVIVAIKSVRAIEPVFFKQVTTCLTLADKRLGLLINFNAVMLRNGVGRIANGLED